MIEVFKKLILNKKNYLLEMDYKLLEFSFSVGVMFENHSSISKPIRAIKIINKDTLIK